MQHQLQQQMLNKLFLMISKLLAYHGSERDREMHQWLHYELRQLNICYILSSFSDVMAVSTANNNTLNAHPPIFISQSHFIPFGNINHFDN
jgi:hypothetical protein